MSHVAMNIGAQLKVYFMKTWESLWGAVWKEENGTSKGKKSHLTKQLKLRDNKFPLRIPMETGLCVWWCHRPGAAHKLGLVLCVCSLGFDSLRPHGLQPTRLPCPWNFPGKNTGMGYHFLFQEILLTQGSNPHLLHLLHWQGDSLALPC